MAGFRFLKGRLVGGLLRYASRWQNPREPIAPVSLVPFDPERDGEILQKWLRAAHVARWWGDPDHALEHALMPPAGGDHALVKLGEKPVGYLRWKVPPRHALEEVGMADIPEGTIDIDILIGEEENTGRGIGTLTLRLLVTRLAESRPPLLMICSSTANARAVRAYEKAGFQRIRKFTDPAFGEMWLFTLFPER